ncbi:Signal transduction histidine kinase [Micromonospora inositola]|uniref:histidine kinase n=1 Tax=Micromonospora inositola TaxID=47865 RepID=A0A1C5J923_9ACTN|nr:Signal transduction histidine kinase [Micromonospora inositola]
MGADGNRSRARLSTVRARTTIAATIVVGFALVITAVSLVVFLRRSLVERVDDIARARAYDVAALARQGMLPADLAVEGDDGSIAQVVDGAGRVVSATAGLRRDQSLARFRPPGAAPEVRTVDDVPFGEGGSYRVIALPTATPGGPATVYVAASLSPVDDAVEVLQSALAAGAPLLLALVAFTTWTVAGRTLRPVDAIRAEVADISERSLDRRVSVPPTDDEISRLAGTMNMMLDRLHAAAERQRRFVADASHELQTPLAAARTDLEVALAHPDRTNWNDTAADLLAANRRMERLVRDLLFLARADAGAPRAATRPVDLDDIVLSEAARIRGGGHLRVDTGAVSAAAVDGRRDDLTRAVRNLFDNAEHYASSSVRVELGSDDRRVRLIVHDDGPGIPAADRKRAFERFTRLDEDRSRRTGGTGLGLAIAKEIIDAHGGSIVVEDAPRGARFVIRLPAR